MESVSLQWLGYRQDDRILPKNTKKICFGSGEKISTFFYFPELAPNNYHLLALYRNNYRLRLIFHLSVYNIIFFKLQFKYYNHIISYINVIINNNLFHFYHDILKLRQVSENCSDKKQFQYILLKMSQISFWLYDYDECFRLSYYTL